jgi:hypothetical protein
MNAGGLESSVLCVTESAHLCCGELTSSACSCDQTNVSLQQSWQSHVLVIGAAVIQPSVDGWGVGLMKQSLSHFIIRLNMQPT